MNRAERLILGVYAAWAALVVLAAFARDGLSPDNLTRALVIAYGAFHFAWYWRTRRRAEPARAATYVLRCSLHALAIELCYMFSRPVFPGLRVSTETAAATAIANTLIDFAFTFPAYLAIFSVMWLLIARWHWRISEYALLFSLGQALGDGNAFFLANPGMLVFVPYVMLNYQAINVVPYLRLRERLPVVPARSVARYILPLVAIPAVYWVTGSCILFVGRRLGLA